jgi:hypothetical protein
MRGFLKTFSEKLRLFSRTARLFKYIFSGIEQMLPRILLFKENHEKMSQIAYKITLLCMATIVARKTSHTLGTVGIEDFLKCCEAFQKIRGFFITFKEKWRLFSVM